MLSLLPEPTKELKEWVLQVQRSMPTRDLPSLDGVLNASLLVFGLDLDLHLHAAFPRCIPLVWKDSLLQALPLFGVSVLHPCGPHDRTRGLALRDLQQCLKTTTRQGRELVVLKLAAFPWCRSGSRGGGLTQAPRGWVGGFRVWARRRLERL